MGVEKEKVVIGDGFESVIHPVGVEYLIRLESFTGFLATVFEAGF